LSSPSDATTAAKIKVPLTTNQKRSFWAAWGGWAMDGMDSFIYALVLAPAMRDLLPRTGIDATQANVGYYGALLFALFMIGWGIALIWGPIADKFGRARTLMLTILWFSVFTFLAATSHSVWALAFYRFMAGIGIGGEWSVGASLVNEAIPESRRVRFGGLMHTGYYFGFFVASLANYIITPLHLNILGADVPGWRLMFIIGGLPAILVAYFFNRIHEPEKWKDAKAKVGEKAGMATFFAGAFSPEYRGRTILNSIFMLASISGLWAGSAYVPTAITYLANQAGRAADGPRYAAVAGVILSIGTILGAIFSSDLGEKFGRRAALGFFYGLMFVFIIGAFGVVYYLPPEANPLMLFMICTFFLGVGGASFAVYSFWIPEQYRTECRVSAFAFSTNIGRFVGAGISFALAEGIAYYGSLGVPVAWTAVFFALSIFLLPWGVETKGKGLPT
jgi:MFS family permease